MDLIEQKVKEITSGLDLDRSIIEIFKYVRDIPYKIVTYEDAPTLLKKKCGDCRAKCDLLAKMFRFVGIPVRLGFARFNWQDLPAPREFFEELGHIGTIWMHIPLQIKRERKWIYVDATWDSKLKKLGFPVNENWNGYNNTKLITERPIDTTFNPVIKWIKMQKEKFSIMKYLAEYSEFAEKFNQYLEKRRK